MTRSELWLRVWHSLAVQGREYLCRMLQQRCLTYVSRRPRLKQFSIIGEEVFSEVMAKLLSPHLDAGVIWRLEEFERDVLSPLQQRICDAPGEDGRIAWLISELANSTALQHRCIDIVRRGGMRGGVGLAPQSGLESDNELHHPAADAATQTLSPSGQQSGADIRRIKSGLLCLAQAIFQRNHDCLCLMHALSDVPRTCGSGDISWNVQYCAGLHATAAREGAVPTLTRLLTAKYPDTPWTDHRVDTVYTLFFLDWEAKKLVELTDNLETSPQAIANDDKTARKKIVAEWNHRMPKDPMTTVRLESLITRTKNVFSLWDGLEIFNFKAGNYHGSDESSNLVVRHTDVLFGKDHVASAWSKERFGRAKTKLQALLSDWDVLKVVEALWDDSDLQDEISIYSTKAWPHRQIAEKLQLVHAFPAWTAGRVEQAIRKFRATIEKYREQHGLDPADFEVLLAKLGRRLEATMEVENIVPSEMVFSLRRER